jgi:pre-mRNA-splicing factor SYF2
LDLIKPDLTAYNRQKEIAMGLAPGTLVGGGGTASSINQFDPGVGSSTQVVPTSQEQRLATENLYRDANSLLYADNKPSEDAIDRVISKMNREYVLFSLPQRHHLIIV